MKAPWIPIIFGALSAFFLLRALIDLKKKGPPATPARKTWFRIGLIFACVSLYLLFVQGRGQ